MGVSAWCHQTPYLVFNKWAGSFSGVPLFAEHENLCKYMVPSNTILGILMSGLVLLNEVKRGPTVRKALKLVSGKSK